MDTVILDAFDEKQDREAIAAAAQVIRRGGLCAFPTETVYGLGADALNVDAVRKIFEAKGRPQDNPLIVHVSCLDEIPPLVEKFDSRAVALAKQFWPGPLTMILPRSERVPACVSAGLKTVAIRLPSNPIARALIRVSGRPIAAPSANLSGRPSPTTAQHVIADLSGRVDMILRSAPCTVGLESTVVSLIEEKPRLLRPGFITAEQLSAVCGPVEMDRAVFHSVAGDAVVHAPGMKYKHYAPHATVKIVKGDFDAYCRFVTEHAAPGVVAMCFDGEGKSLPIPFVEYGHEASPSEQAQQLFDVLHRVDELGAEVVYARCPSCKGVGLAVANRLFKAAGFEVIEL